MIEINNIQDNLHAYTLFARTEERKREWIEAFADALDNVMPSLNNKVGGTFK